MDELPLIDKQKPFIESDGSINIHETFLSHIWSITFSIFVIYEEGIVIPDYFRRGLEPPKLQNLALLDLAKELFDYSKSLITVFSKWDKDYYPNPEYYDEKSEEAYYILKTNDLYVEVINFILYHEIAHAEFEHITKKNVGSLTNDEIKNLEIEADTRAIELMLFKCDHIIKTEISIAIGLASMLFSGKDLHGGKNHPAKDVRLANFLTIINLSDDSPVWSILVIFLKLWEEQFSYNFTQKNEYVTYKELYYDLLNQATKKKQ